MIIEPIRIPESGKTYVGDEEASHFLNFESKTDFSPTGNLHYELKAILVSRQLIVTGKVTASVVARCSRCAEETVFKVSDGSFSAVREIDDPTESVDLTDELRESMLLALPAYPVCRQDCQGLCAHCGVNLNKEPCSCKETKDTGWQALDKLNIK